MVTGASTADVAVILDRRPQGRAHPDPPAQLPGVAARHPPRRAGGQQDRPRRLLARTSFDRSRPTTAPSPPRSGSSDVDLRSRCRRCGATTSPSRAPARPWYDGPTLHGVPRDGRGRRRRGQAGPFRMPVQWVNRPDLDFRGFSGRSSAAPSRPGDAGAGAAVRAESTVERIVTFDGDLDEAVAGQSVTLTLADEIDVSRGDVSAPARRAGRGRPTSSRRTSSGCPRSRCCRAGSTC